MAPLSVLYGQPLVPGWLLILWEPLSSDNGPGLLTLTVPVTCGSGLDVAFIVSGSREAGCFSDRPFGFIAGCIVVMS